MPHFYDPHSYDESNRRRRRPGWMDGRTLTTATFDMKKMIWQNVIKICWGANSDYGRWWSEDRGTRWLATRLAYSAFKRLLDGRTRLDNDNMSSLTKWRDTGDTAAVEVFDGRGNDVDDSGSCEMARCTCVMHQSWVVLLAPRSVIDTRWCGVNVCGGIKDALLWRVAYFWGGWFMVLPRLFRSIDTDYKRAMLLLQWCWWW